MALKYLLEKEFKQFFRNKFMPAMAVIFPLLVMLVMPWAATLDIKNIKVAVIDSDYSPKSELFVQKIGNSTYFDLTSLVNNYNEGIEQLEYGHADIVLEIPAGFENDLVNFGTAPIQISVNAVNSIKGMMGQSYISTLAREFSQEQATGANIQAGQAIPNIELVTKNMYNSTLDYKHTMIPGLIMIIMVVLCGFLPAVNIVIEKETGTIEQINVTPINKFIFILAKLIPYWVIGLVALSICFLFAWLIFGMVPVGSWITLYVFSILFILTMTGFGLVVSNYSSTVQQAIFVMFFFIMISIMMSGLLTPVNSMPDWAQGIAAFTPTKYIVNVLRCIYLKGSGFADLWLDLVALIIMTLFFTIWAVLSYKKSSK